MPFLRLSRDQRGYETTFLLHAAHYGESPRVLYWYRSAPGVRVGRPALDEDAIRTIEDQHPDIEFDWAQILEVGAAMAADFDHRADRDADRGSPRGSDRGAQRGARAGDQERGRRKTSRPRGEPAPPVPTAGASGASSAAPGPYSTSAVTLQSLSAAAPAVEPEPEQQVEAQPSDERPHHAQPPPEAARRGPDVLSELAGREIATRLRARYSGITARIDEHGVDDAGRAAWRARAAALDPDSWVTPEEILRGVQQADRLLDQLRRDLDR